MLLLLALAVPRVFASAQGVDGARLPMLLLRSFQQKLGKDFNPQLGQQVHTILRERQTQVGLCREEFFQEAAQASGLPAEQIRDLEANQPVAEPGKTDPIIALVETRLGKPLAAQQRKSLDAALQKRADGLERANSALAQRAAAATGISTAEVRGMIAKAGESAQTPGEGMPSFGNFGRPVVPLLAAFFALSLAGFLVPRLSLEFHRRGRVALALVLLVLGAQQFILLKEASSYGALGSSAGQVIAIAGFSLVSGVLMLIPATSRPVCVLFAAVMIVTALADLRVVVAAMGSEGWLAGMLEVLKRSRFGFPRFVLMMWALWFGVRKPAGS